MLSAHKYVQDDAAAGGKRRVNYVRPDHLWRQSGVHLRLLFDQPVPGPLLMGSGRHCGLGVFAAVGED